MKLYETWETVRPDISGKTLFVNKEEDTFYFGDFSYTGHDPSTFWFLELLGRTGDATLTAEKPSLDKYLDQLKVFRASNTWL